MLYSVLNHRKAHNNNVVQSIHTLLHNLVDTYSLEKTEKEVYHNASGVVIKTWIGLPVKSIFTNITH